MTKLLAVLAMTVLMLTGCAPAASSSIDITTDTVVIDVRTADEFAQGHLDGAVNIDVQSDQFESLVTALPTDGTYVVYCRSGSRAAAAIDRMTSLGFTDLTNAGGLDAASAATGLAIVTTP
jgi:phage shock protein E